MTGSLNDHVYHLGPDPRLGKKQAVTRFNLFVPDPPGRILSSFVEPAAARLCTETFFALLLQQYRRPRFALFLDLHEGGFPELGSRVIDGAWPPAGLGAWYQEGNKTALELTEPVGITWVSETANHLGDGTAFFRIRENLQESTSEVAGGPAITKIPGRSEEDYVSLLPPFHAVGIVECQSCFMSVMSRVDDLTHLIAASIRLGARSST